MARHLGNTEEQIDFLMNMNEQLVKHKREKEPLGNDDLDEAIRLSINEIQHRLKNIRRLARGLRHSKDPVGDQNEITSQLRVANSSSCRPDGLQR